MGVWYLPDSPMLARKCVRVGSVYMPAFTAVRTTKVWIPDIVLCQEPAYSHQEENTRPRGEGILVIGYDIVDDRTHDAAAEARATARNDPVLLFSHLRCISRDCNSPGMLSQVKCDTDAVTALPG